MLLDLYTAEQGTRPPLPIGASGGGTKYVNLRATDPTEVLQAAAKRRRLLEDELITMWLGVQ